MTLQNQPVLPEAASENQTTRTYADLASLLMRVMFLFEKYNLTLARAHNESRVNEYGSRIHYVYRKRSVHISVLLKQTIGSLPMLCVSLSFPFSDEGEINKYKGKILVICYADSQPWETLILLFVDSDSTKDLRRITKEACHIEIPSDQNERIYTSVLTEQRAFEAITGFIEVFKSSSREPS